MTEAIMPYDSANYLRDEEDIAAYLAAAAEDGSPAVMTLALGAIARARSMTQLARDTGITREGLYKALSAGGNPSFATVTKVAGALGFPLIFQMPPTRPAKLSRLRKPSAYLRDGRQLVRPAHYQTHTG